MNEFVPILDEAMNEMKTNSKRVESVDEGTTPLIFKGWNYCLDLKKKKINTFTNDFKIVEKLNRYPNAIANEPFKMRFIFPRPDSLQKWIIECLNILKEDSILMEQMKAIQIGFSEYYFALGKNTVVVKRDVEREYDGILIDWFENRIFQGRHRYGGFGLKKCLEYFFSGNFKKDELFFTLPSELRDLIVQHE